MKIVFYNETIMSGGIEKCIELLIEHICIENKIEIVYVDDKKLDNKVVSILERRAKVHKLKENERIEADICIWCRLYMDYNKLKKQIVAKQNYLWVHSKPREKEGCILDDKEFIKDIDKIICVSEDVQKKLKVNKESMVIHNFLPSNIEKLSENKEADNFKNNKQTLKLATVSRLSSGKGFNRVYLLVKELIKNKIDFEYIIVGKGRAKEEEIRNMFDGIKEVKFVGYKENPYPYIKKADYLVQLSDYETWGNVITEAKQLGTPVIATGFQSVYEQIKDDENGIIIELEENNYAKYLKRIINNCQKYKDNLKGFNYNNELNKWNKIIRNN